MDYLNHSDDNLTKVTKYFFKIVFILIFISIVVVISIVTFKQAIFHKECYYRVKIGWSSYSNPNNKGITEFTYCIEDAEKLVQDMNKLNTDSIHWVIRD